jgi:hypothetical protein
MKRPSFQFYPGDWLNDAGLRLCSVGARGLWIEMICLMHQGSDYGYLKVNHAPILPANLASISGATMAEVDGWLLELEKYGVFSRDGDGCIFSRRMISDEKVRAARAAGGILGGNPQLTQGGKGSLKVGSKVNHQANLQTTPSSSSSSSSSGNTPQPPKGEPKGFKEFYEAYPRKQGRAPAAKAFAKVVAPLAQLLAAIELQKRSEQWTKDGGQFIPLPATWLNQCRWEDQIDATAFAQGKDPDSRACVEEDGVALGVGMWNENTEQWPQYKARVRAAQGTTA